MEAKTKKALLIVTSLLVIGGGVVGVILWKRNKDKEAAEAEKERLRVEHEESERVRKSSGGGSGGSTKSTAPGVPTEKTTIKEFQEYANSQGSSLKVDGKWGPNTQTAWDSHGDNFLKLDAVKADNVAKASENYLSAQKAMGSRAKVYVDYTTLMSEPKNYGLSGGGGNKVFLVTKQGGFWQLYFIPVGTKFADKKLVAKGRFYQGGKRLTIGVGKNKGVIIKASTYSKALIKAVKS